MNVREFWEKVWLKPHGASSSLYLLFDVKPSEVVLDVGCGDWAYAYSLLDKSKMAVGCDISYNALKQAKYYARDYKNKTDFVQCDARYLPFRDNAFDRVVSFETITLIGDGYKKVFEEMRRVTKKYVTFDVNHKETAPRAEEEGLSVVTFDEAELKKLLDEVGLSIESMEVYDRETIDNLGLPIYEWEYVPDGDKKRAIFVTARKST